MNEMESMSYNPFRWARVLLRAIPRILSDTASRVPLCTSAEVEQEVFPLSAAPESEGLLVVLHGFRQSRPSLMRSLDPLRALQLPFREMYVPHVNYDVDDLLAMEGNAALLAHVREFCHDHPHEPLMLVGMSAGGRLAVALQNALRYVDHTHIHTVTLVAPLAGSRLVQLSPGMMPVWRWLLGPFADQLDPNGGSQAMLKHMLETAGQPHRTFAHFYSTTDYLVFPPANCVSSVGTRHALHNCSHGEALTHPDVLHYLATFLFPVVQVHGGLSG